MGKPINKTNIFNTESVVSSDTIVWEGPNIPCIELCTGDRVSNVIVKIAEKLCTLVDNVDELKDLDYSCIIESLDYTGPLTKPENFSLKLLFQLLLDNDCKLQDLINSALKSSSSSNINIQGLKLNCITNEILNLCGQIPETLEVVKVLQAIINILCGVVDSVADILIRLITLEAKFESLGDPGDGGYIEPSITSCLSPLDGSNNPIPSLMRDHIVNVTDPAICNLNAIVGNKTDLDNLLSSQCLGDYISNTSVNQNASNIAQAAANKEVIICNLLERISTIENSCCSFDCSDIHIGFIESFNSTTNIFSIEFSYGAGTNIPLLFTDCGSTFILEDWKGVQLTQNNSANTLHNGTIITIPVASSGLDLSKPLSLQIKTCFTNTQTGLICKDCFGGVVSSASIASISCWDFIVPKTDALGCGNKNINYYSLSTSQGTYLSGGGNTSVSNNLVMPSFNSPNTISNTVVCTNKLVITLENQSALYPPELNLLITQVSPALYIKVVGTLNTSCGC